MATSQDQWLADSGWGWTDPSGEGSPGHEAFRPLNPTGNFNEGGAMLPLGPNSTGVAIGGAGGDDGGNLRSLIGQRYNSIFVDPAGVQSWGSKGISLDDDGSPWGGPNGARLTDDGTRVRVGSAELWSPKVLEALSKMGVKDPNSLIKQDAVNGRTMSVDDFKKIAPIREQEAMANETSLDSGVSLSLMMATMVAGGAALAGAATGAAGTGVAGAFDAAGVGTGIDAGVMASDAGLSSVGGVGGAFDAAGIGNGVDAGVNASDAGLSQVNGVAAASEGAGGAFDAAGTGEGVDAGTVASDAGLGQVNGNAAAAGSASSVGTQAGKGLIDSALDHIKDLPGKALEDAQNSPITTALRVGSIASSLTGGGATPASQELNNNVTTTQPPAIATSDFSNVGLGISPRAGAILNYTNGRPVFGKGGLILSNIGGV